MGVIELADLRGKPAMLYYEQTGTKGIPIVFLHGGWGYSLYPIDFQIAALRDNCRLIIPTRLGYGRSSAITHFEETFHRLAGHEMQMFLEACGIDKCILWGHSDGAVIAAWMGLESPDNFCGLILESFHFFRKKAGSVEFFSIAAGRPDEIRESARRALEAEHGSDRWRRVLKISGDAWLNIIDRAKSAMADLYDGRLSELRVPTIFLHSQNDPRSEPLEMKTAQSELPGAGFYFFETGGHSPHTHVDTRAECTRIIVDFVGKVTERCQ